MTALIADGLFRLEGDRSVLFGSKRRSTGAVKFPAEPRELSDRADDIVPVELSTRGTLFTFTTQEFPPPLPFRGDRSPELFKPYVVGYVELPEGVLVESLIVGVDVTDLHIGQEMVSTTTLLDTADGQSLTTFAFTTA